MDTKSNNPVGLNDWKCGTVSITISGKDLTPEGRKAVMERWLEHYEKNCKLNEEAFRKTICQMFGGEVDLELPITVKFHKDGHSCELTFEYIKGSGTIKGDVSHLQINHRGMTIMRYEMKKDPKRI
ncbi:MAG: hypothetical protein KKH61_20425 [Gammaproteobacteria bacterium]|nr:hypothetical protein [Gammaproteobacteria bacterium]